MFVLDCANEKKCYEVLSSTEIPICSMEMNKQALKPGITS